MIAFVIVASALRFATQLLNVSVPQAIGWSQIEISLAIILACAPMCVKLLLAPLIDHREMEKKSEGLQFVGTPTSMTRRPTSETSVYSLYESKSRASTNMGSSPLVQQQLAARQASFSVPGRQSIGSELRAEQVPPKYGRKSSALSVETGLTIAEDSRNPGDIDSPDYQRLKVVRAEVNGQSVWEVSNDCSTAFQVEPEAYSSP